MLATAHATVHVRVGYARISVVGLLMLARTRAGALVCCGGVGSVRSRIDRLLQLAAQVVLSAATCIVACNKSNATQPACSRL